MQSCQDRGGDRAMPSGNDMPVTVIGAKMAAHDLTLADEDVRRPCGVWTIQRLLAASYAAL